jgi:hypothetical protein
MESRQTAYIEKYTPHQNVKIYYVQSIMWPDCAGIIIFEVELVARLQRGFPS